MPKVSAARFWWLIVIVAAGLLAATPAAPAGATPGPVLGGHRSIIEVYPGPNALAEALAGAQPGDTLNLHAGVYKEHVSVATANLTLTAAGDGRVVVNGGCDAQYTINVTSNGVTINGITVKGADEGFGSYPAEVDYTGVSTGALTNTVLKDSCDAEYGVSVYSSGTVTVSGNTTVGFSDSGIYIGAITSTHGGALKVQATRRSATAAGSSWRIPRGPGQGPFEHHPRQLRGRDLPDQQRRRPDPDQHDHQRRHVGDRARLELGRQHGHGEHGERAHLRPRQRRRQWKLLPEQHVHDPLRHDRLLNPPAGSGGPADRIASVSWWP